MTMLYNSSILLSASKVAGSYHHMHTHKLSYNFITVHVILTFDPSLRDVDSGVMCLFNKAKVPFKLV